MAGTLLEIENLNVSFQTGGEITVAVNNVSFKLNKGQTIGIVGESGSGKSVTSLSLMRLVPQPPGKITADKIELSLAKSATNILQLSEKEMRNYRGNEIAMIFQEPMTSLNPVYTCGDQVMEVIQRHTGISRSEARKRTIELFKLVELPRPEGMVDSYPHQLSGGQKQRVMITMAISCNPKLLIADEPTTALDVTVQKQILLLLKKLQKELGMGMIFITHDLGVVAEVADDILVMYRGNVVEQGPVAQILRNPRHPYTKGLIACRPKLNEKPQVLPTIADFMHVNDDGQLVEIEMKTGRKSENIEMPIIEKQSLLQVKNLKTWFPVKAGIFGRTSHFVKAVDDVSFEVYPGETLGLVGESGCGKTTLGRTILRLVEPTSGEIFYKGREITKLKTEEMRELRKSMQIIFQDPYSSLNPRTTIGNALMEPMRVHQILNNDKERRNKVIALLERVNLKAEHFNRYPHEFSGGQRQRICIARALVMAPEFIICDESVSALDVSVQAQVLNLLNELKREFGFTYIFISHDLSVVKYMSDRMIVMNKGKIEEMGVAAEIYANPQSSYTKKLISSIPTGQVFLS